MTQFPLCSCWPMQHMLPVTEQQSSSPLTAPSNLQWIQSLIHSFALHAVVRDGKGRLELLSEAQAHLVLFSVFTHNDYNLVYAQEDDNKPQKQQFNLVKSKQIL